MSSYALFARHLTRAAVSEVCRVSLFISLYVPSIIPLFMGIFVSPCIVQGSFIITPITLEFTPSSIKNQKLT